FRCSVSSPRTASPSPCWRTSRCTTSVAPRCRPTTSAGSAPSSKPGSRPPGSWRCSPRARPATCTGWTTASRRRGRASTSTPTRELKLQALRVGDLGVAAIPNEVFALTGLKIKGRSPLRTTFTIELANGAEGYIPPPEQHVLGGYTTWPARTAALEETAEPKIAQAITKLLEEVSGQKRKKPREPQGPYAQAILAAKPAAYWRMDEFAAPQCFDR